MAVGLWQEATKTLSNPTEQASAPQYTKIGFNTNDAILRHQLRLLSCLLYESVSTPKAVYHTFGRRVNPFFKPGQGHALSNLDLVDRRAAVPAPNSRFFRPVGTTDCRCDDPFASLPQSRQKIDG